jgi:recombinational DNA repair protein (RecF pathway)
MSLSGWRPFLDSCSICSKSVSKIEEDGFGIFFSNVSGGVTCYEHKGSDAQKIYFLDLRYMFALLNYDWKTAGDADAREISRATRVLDSYFKYHVEKRITSLRFV